MFNEYESKAIERISFLAKNNGAIASTKLATEKLDFGKWILQFHGNYMLDLMSPDKEVNYVLQSISQSTLSVEPCQTKYRKLLFGFAGGKLEIKCSEWYQLEEVSENIMKLLIKNFKNPLNH